MKKLLFCVSIPVIVLASCSKEEVIVNSSNTPVSENGITIKAYVVDKDITKTSYAGETTFSWIGNECLSVQLIKKSDSTRDRWLFYNETEAGGASARFISANGPSGALSAETWGLGEYAFYPFPGNSYCPERLKSWNVGSLQAVNSGTAEQRAKNVIVSPLFISSVSNPLQLVPMIGYKDGESAFGFHTATGILKITVTSIDSRLAKVQLYSNGQKLNGTFTMTGTGADAYLAMTTSGTASENVVESQYSDWTDETELAFYFPVPVGELSSGFEIRLLDSGDNVLKTVSAPSAVTIYRNRISEITKKIALPAEDFSASITPTGTSAALTASVVLGSNATSVKLVLASSADAGYTLIDSGNASVITLDASGSTETFAYSNISSTGTNYIVAKTYKGDTAKNSYSIPVKVLNSTDAAKCGQFTRTTTNITSPTTVTPSDWSGAHTLTIEASNDPANSLYMITEFAGFSYDPTKTTAAAKTASGITLSATVGSPLYCSTTLANGTGSSTFSSSGPFFTDNSGGEYYLTDYDGGGNKTGYVRITYNTKYYTSPETTNDLCVFGASIQLYKKTPETNVLKVSHYVGNK